MFRLAARAGTKKVASLLLKTGAQIEARNTTKNTPLIVAAKNGHRALADYFVDLGANLNAKNKFDSSCKSFYEECGEFEEKNEKERAKKQ